MGEVVDRLYYLLYNPLVTPANLISNVKLPNYGQLVFQKQEKGLLASIECYLENTDVVEFLYYFDEKDFLKRVVCVNRASKTEEVLFDRNKEADILQKKLIKSKEEQTSKLAI